MKKGSLVVTFMGTIGGILLAIGMCMCLLPEWGAFVPGIVIGGMGIIVLLTMIPAYRKATGRSPVHLDKAFILSLVIGIIGILALGVGLAMCIMAESGLSIPGLILGVVGILICVSNYPIYAAQKK